MSASKKSLKKKKPAKAKAKRIKKSSGQTKAAVTRSKAQAKPAKKKAGTRKAATKKRPAVAAASIPTRKNQKRNQASAGPTIKVDSDLESGDLQGLGTIAEADSESASELLEEGNAFEAGVVGGVEEAGDEPEREVHARQVREDDVPEEYLETE